jgi:RES domain-containing protein
MPPERTGVVLGLVDPTLRPALEAALRRNRATDRLDTAFTAPFRPSRYTDGTFPAFYVAADATTALKEKLHHDANWLRGKGIGVHHHAVQLLEVIVDGELEDVRPLALTEPDLVHATDYGACQNLAQARRAAGAAGLLYPSVRDTGAPCAVIFDRTVVANLRYLKSINIEWDGKNFVEDGTIKI